MFAWTARFESTFAYIAEEKRRKKKKEREQYLTCTRDENVTFF